MKNAKRVRPNWRPCHSRRESWTDRSPRYRIVDTGDRITLPLNRGALRFARSLARSLAPLINCNAAPIQKRIAWLLPVESRRCKGGRGDRESGENYAPAVISTNKRGAETRGTRAPQPLSRCLRERGQIIFQSVTPSHYLPSFFFSLSLLPFPSLLLFPTTEPHGLDTTVVRSLEEGEVYRCWFFGFIHFFSFFFFILFSISVSLYARGLPRKIEFLGEGGGVRNSSLERSIDRLLSFRSFVDILIVHESENEKLKREIVKGSGKKTISIITAFFVICLVRFESFAARAVRFFATSPRFHENMNMHAVYHHREIFTEQFYCVPSVLCKRGRGDGNIFLFSFSRGGCVIPICTTTCKMVLAFLYVCTSARVHFHLRYVITKRMKRNLPR